MRYAAIMVLLVASMVPATAFASTASITFFDIPSTDIGLDFRDGGSEIRTVRDDDNDGVIQFEFDTLVVETVYSDEDCLIWDIVGPQVHVPQAVPLFETPAGGSLITLLDLSAPVGAVSVGQRIPVVDGESQFGGLVILESAGIGSLADLMASDWRNLPRYTGDAIVTQRVEVHVVPEPTSFALIIFASLSTLVSRRGRSRRITL